MFPLSITLFFPAHLHRHAKNAKTEESASQPQPVETDSSSVRYELMTDLCIVRNVQSSKKKVLVKIIYCSGFITLVIIKS